MKYNREEIREIYRELFEYSLDFLYVSDLKGNFLDANDIALETLGFEHDEIPKISFINLINKDQLKDALNRVKEIQEIGRNTTRGEYRLKTKDGNYIYITTYGIPIKKKGKIYAILGIGVNITERKIAEQYLKESEERYRAFYENTPFTIAIIKVDGIIVDCNPTVQTLLGY